MEGIVTQTRNYIPIEFPERIDVKTTIRIKNVLRNVSKKKKSTIMLVRIYIYGRLDVIIVM